MINDAKYSKVTESKFLFAIIRSSSSSSRTINLPAIILVPVLEREAVFSPNSTRYESCGHSVTCGALSLQVALFTKSIPCSYALSMVVATRCLWL